MHGKITRCLYQCREGDSCNVDKFFSLCPNSDSVKKDLVNLESLGYIALDYGDDRITAIALNDKFLKLFKEDH